MMDLQRNIKHKKIPFPAGCKARREIAMGAPSWSPIAGENSPRARPREYLIRSDFRKNITWDRSVVKIALRPTMRYRFPLPASQAALSIPQDQAND
jgi:hypothetical protein